MTEALRNRLRDQRERLGLTQAELAERVGVSRKTVNTIENRVFVPSALLAIKLAHAVGRTVEDVFWVEAEQAAPLTGRPPYPDGVQLSRMVRGVPGD